MNSLKIKILVLISVIMFGAISLIAWYNLKIQHDILAKSTENTGQLLVKTVRNSIRSSMINSKNSEVRKILEHIGEDPSIEDIKIFDDTGRILVSAKHFDIGSLTTTSELLSYRANRLNFTETIDDVERFTTLIPLENSSECIGCHQHDKPVLGILSLQMSLNQINNLQLAGRNATLFSSLGTLALLIVAITLFILIYVDAPIRKLVNAMQKVEAGEFDHATINITSSEEMFELATKFNNMVGRLKFLVESTIKHECELVVHREKLSHHDAIQSMNVTLEERLKEIEYLNISLEEHIEEIEEANYKIADLASDLENKNSSLEMTVSRLSALHKMGLALNSTMDLEKLFDILIRRTMEAVGSRIGYILLLDSGQWSLKIGGSVGLAETYNRNTRIALKPGGVSYWVIENRQPILIEKMETTNDFNKISTLGYTRETIICAPLLIKDEIIGTITIANKNDGTPFNANDLELLTTIGAQASVAIKNVRLYEEQKTTYLSTVQALVSAIEASDPYTRGHSERVTRYAQLLGQQINLSTDALKRLEHAAVLHDIGKIGIDLALLHKQGQLSTSDIDALQQHPLIGARILEPITFLNGVREIIVQHHERYDGCGYPFRIKGDEIYMEARILAVADTYDAMTSDRPYRKALSHDTALNEIRTYAGTQFDPTVAEAMNTICAAGLWPPFSK